MREIFTCTPSSGQCSLKTGPLCSILGIEETISLQLHPVRGYATLAPRPRHTSRFSRSERGQRQRGACWTGRTQDGPAQAHRPACRQPRSAPPRLSTWDPCDAVDAGRAAATRVQAAPFGPAPGAARRAVQPLRTQLQDHPAHALDLSVQALGRCLVVRCHLSLLHRTRKERKKALTESTEAKLGRAIYRPVGDGPAVWYSDVRLR